MSGNAKRFGAPALILAGALAASAAVAGAGQAPGPDGAVERCAIAVTASGNALTLEGVYHAEAAGAGVYSFKVHSVGGAGRTQIAQGGGFSARAGETLTLGRVTLGGGSVYDVSLSVDAGGTAHDCKGRVGGAV